MDDLAACALNPYVLTVGRIHDGNCLPADGSFGRRLCSWYEVELITGGEGEIRINGVGISASRGDIFVRKPGMQNEGVGSYRCFIAAFDPLFSEGRTSGAGGVYGEKSPLDAWKWRTAPEPELGVDLGLPLSFRTTRFDELSTHFTSLHREFYESRSRLKLKLYLLQIIAILQSDWESVNHAYRDSRSVRNNYRAVREVCRYVDENPEDSFSLAGLAERAGLSRTFFCRVFKQISGRTPFAYIQERRIARAKRLLVETSDSVKQIAYACGFRSETYFYVSFRRMTSQSPLGFRDSANALHAAERLSADYRLTAD
jgi:AraC-like DNA-binding protein